MTESAGSPAEPRALIPLAVYEADPAWARVRALSALVFALVWAVGMFAFALVAMGFSGRLDGYGFKVAAIISLLGSGVVGALGFEWAAPVERRKVEALLARIYHGDPGLVPPPPPAETYPLRLPCAVVLGPASLMGGVLYLGPAGFLFVPHLRNAPALQTPVPMGPVRSIVIERVWFRNARLARFYSGRFGEALRIRWLGGMLLIVVPAAMDTMRLIDAELLRWKFDPPASYGSLPG